VRRRRRIRELRDELNTTRCILHLLADLPELESFCWFLRRYPGESFAISVLILYNLYCTVNTMYSNGTDVIL